MSTIDQFPVQDLPNEVIDKLRQSAAMAANNEQTTRKTLSIKNSKFSVDDNRIPAPLKVVILSIIYENKYYDSPYSPDLITSPACFALSISNDLVPHENSPKIQAESCDECAQNVYGSAKTGAGKACRNGRKLLLAAYNEETGEVSLEQSDIVLLSIPPTSLKSISGYVKAVTTRTKLPIYSVVTSISFDEDSDYPRLMFSYDKNINSSDLTKILSLEEEFLNELMEPYSSELYAEPTNQEQKTTKSKMS